jgi:hypothetical protein
MINLDRQKERPEPSFAWLARGSYPWQHPVEISSNPSPDLATVLFSRNQPHNDAGNG